MAYADRLGSELVSAVILKCSDLGGHSWAYVRKALAEAESQGCRSAEEYRLTNPIGAGRNKRVDRTEPSGNDWLKSHAAQPLIKKKNKGGTHPIYGTLKPLPGSDGGCGPLSAAQKGEPFEYRKTV